MTSTDRLRTSLSDRYRIEREIGSGGMATVYLAHDLKHDRAVAIKVVHQVLQPQCLFAVAPFVLYGIFNRNYDVMPDDRRFLMIQRNEEQTTRLVAVFNWRAQLPVR